MSSQVSRFGTESRLLQDTQVRSALGRLRHDLVRAQVIRVFEEKPTEQQDRVSSEQVKDEGASEMFEVVEAQGNLRVERQNPVHLGLQQKVLVGVDDDVVLGPGVDGTNHLES